MDDIIFPSSYEEGVSLLAEDQARVQLSAGPHGGAVVSWPNAVPEEERDFGGYVYRVCNKQQAVFVRTA